MNIFYEPSQFNRITIGGTEIPEINNRNLLRHYDVDTVPFTIVIPTVDDEGNPQTVSHAFIEVSNAIEYTVSPGNISDQELGLGWTDRINQRRSDLRALEDASALTAGVSSISITIESKINSGLPVKVYRAYALRQIFYLKPDNVFRNPNFEQTENNQVYESLYKETTVIKDIRLAPRESSYSTQFRLPNDRHNLQNVFEQFPEFVFEWHFEELPREIYRAYFNGGWESTYTVRNRDLGFNLGFNIRER